MRTVLKNVVALRMEDGTAEEQEPFHGDIAWIDDQITEVARGIDVSDADRIIDGQHRLVIPGLVNAHIHSWEAFFRGRYDNLPLELWMLLSYPVLGLTPLPPELVRLRTLLVAIESLKNGVTCLLDDVIEMPSQDLNSLQAVVGAYEEAGIRANVSGNVVNRSYADTIPYLQTLLSPSLLGQVDATPTTTTKEYLEFSEAALYYLQGRGDGRIRYVVAPSAPQRCSNDLLIAANDLSERWKTAFHIHVLETKLQAVTGQEFYGKTLISHLENLGVLTARATLAHGIWLSDDDIETLATNGASVAHNPISNLKLGSGIAPWRALHEAGVNVALGTDGASSNDTARMFDVMKTAALLHKISEPDFRRWPDAKEVLWSATRGGAKSVQLDQEVGRLSPGYKADMVILDRNSINFTPQNDLYNHLVYCEQGASIKEVIVNGRTVVADGELVTLDEQAILEEVRRVAPELLARYGQVEAANAVFREHLVKIYKKGAAVDVGFDRWGGGNRSWVLG